MLQNLTAVLTLLAAIAAFVTLVILDRVKRKAAILENQEALGQEAVARDRIEALLVGALPWLCTQAEIALGSGTGDLKLSYVITEALKLVPDDFEGRIKKDILIDFIEDALTDAKETWAGAPGLIVAEQDFASVEKNLAVYDHAAAITEVVPAAVVEALRESEMHLAVNKETGVIVAVPDGKEPDWEKGADQALEIAEATLRRECRKRGLDVDIAYGTPCGPAAKGDPGDPGVPGPQGPHALRPADGGELKECCAEHAKDLCPVGHHWEPDGNGGFVAVLDAPTEEADTDMEAGRQVIRDTAVAHFAEKEAGEAPADDPPQPVHRKRVRAAVEPVAEDEGKTTPAAEDTQEGPAESEDGPAAEEAVEA